MSWNGLPPAITTSLIPETVDPLDERPRVNGAPAHRSIRGGFWGYYGMSQRACDRKYNNPPLSAYIYPGSEVALPAAELKKLGRAAK